MSTSYTCPYADSHRFPANKGGLRTAITKKEVLKAEEQIEAITSASSLRYYVATNVAFIGEPDGLAQSRLYASTMEAWRALDDLVWDLAKSQDKMREAMCMLEEEMNSTSRMEEERDALDRIVERHLLDIQNTIRGNQRRMRREDENFLKRRREEKGDYSPIQQPWRESKKEKKQREGRMREYQWGAEKGTRWGS